MGKKIVHISASDKAGGAAIAAFRHNEALNRLGYDSKLLVANSQSGCRDVVVPDSSRFKIKAKVSGYNYLNNLVAKNSDPYATWSVAKFGLNLAMQPVVKDADIIIIHWINNATLSITGIEDILKLNKKVIWFLHDMWPLTGGCHYSLGCEKFATHCGECPLLFNRIGSNKNKDISYHQFESKIKHWKKYPNQKILAPSKWLVDCAKRSLLFADKQINVYRNCVDERKYKILSKKFAREAINLPQNKKLILFGADSVTSPYKGWEYLNDALNLFNKDEVECVVFGSCNTNVIANKDIKIHYVGKLLDDYSLVLLYNACDVFVTPSIADNYPNVLIEAMACGLPCVGFNIGGIPEIIQHKSTGYISTEISSVGLKDGIDWVLANSADKNLPESSRQWIIDNSSYNSVENQIQVLLN